MWLLLLLMETLDCLYWERRGSTGCWPPVSCPPSPRSPRSPPQLAKARGLHVATTCSAGNAEFVKGLGAEEVVDYTSQDFAGEWRYCREGDGMRGG